MNSFRFLDGYRFLDGTATQEKGSELTISIQVTIYYQNKYTYQFYSKEFIPEKMV